MRTLLAATLTLALGLVVPPPAPAQDAPPPVGRWEGELEAGGTSLTLVLHVATDDTGGLTGTLDSPDQGATGIPLDRVTWEDGRLVATSGALGGGFTGRLAEDGRTLEGTWRQGGGERPLTLTRAGDAAEVQTEPAGPGDPVGSWTGTLDAGGQSLTLVFHVTRRDGALAGSMDSPDQGVNGIPAGEVSLDGSTLTVTVPAIGGALEATLPEDGSTLEGTWSQGGGSFPITLERGEPEPRPRPQEPEPPFPYRVEEVRFENPEAGIELAGTLTLPEGEGPFPAVALVSGSGPQNRDEELLGHKPFLVLADWLTRRGIAVLRYDDRGVAGSGGDFAAATTEDFAGDALAAVRYLEGRPAVAAGRTGIVGHSEGGLAGPIAAGRSDAVDFLVLLAGPGLTGEEIIRLQRRRISEADGAAAPTVELNERLQEALFAALKEAEDAGAARPRLEAVLDSALEAMTPAEREAVGAGSGDPEMWRTTMVEQLATPWFRYFLTYDPVPALTRLDVPVLALLGEKDLQVPAPENAPALRAALERAPTSDATVEVLPGLNHLFQEAETGSPAEYARIEQTMSPRAMDRVAEWILARFGGAS